MPPRSAVSLSGLRAFGTPNGRALAEDMSAGVRGSGGYLYTENVFDFGGAEDFCDWAHSLAPARLRAVRMVRIVWPVNKRAYLQRKWMVGKDGVVGRAEDIRSLLPREMERCSEGRWSTPWEAVRILEEGMQRGQLSLEVVARFNSEPVMENELEIDPAGEAAKLYWLWPLAIVCKGVGEYMDLGVLVKTKPYGSDIIWARQYDKEETRARQNIVEDLIRRAVPGNFGPRPYARCGMRARASRRV